MPAASRKKKNSPERALAAETPPRKWSRRGIVLRAGIAGFVLLLSLGVKFVLHLVMPRNYDGTGQAISLPLLSGPFDILYYAPTGGVKGVVVLGTGDGGWSYWEENTARHLAHQGFAVAGWDCRKFADTRKYSHDDLIDGWRAAADAVKLRARGGTIPIWYGGWSTGAEQAVAAAATDRRPIGLIGLLLAAPGGRGRFGIETSDLLGVPPTGEGSFALEDMAPKLAGLHVAQFTAGLDPIDNIAWLDALKTPYKLYRLSGMMHDMGGAGDAFQATVDQALQWTLDPAPLPAAAPRQ